MCSAREYLEEAIFLTAKWKHFIFIPSLTWDFRRIKSVRKIAMKEGVKDEEWLPVISLWRRLDFITRNGHVAKLRLSIEELDDICKLAELLTMPISKSEITSKVIITS